MGRDEGSICRAADETAGTAPEGTTVVAATLSGDAAASGVTTGFEWGGGVTATGPPDGGTDGRTDGVGLTADRPGGSGLNSIGGWSPPTWAASGAPGSGADPDDTGPLRATAARAPTVRSATPSERNGSGKPERTRQKLARH